MRYAFYISQSHRPHWLCALQSLNLALRSAKPPFCTQVADELFF
jgi:hypothetical protein